MPEFGERSKRNLMTCEPRIRLVCRTAIKVIDFSVIEGSRTDEKQAEYFNSDPKRSHLDGVIKKSKHQVTEDQPLSRAVDLLPYPSDIHGVDIWQDRDRFIYFDGIIMGIASQLGIGLICGIDWNRDFSMTDTGLFDAPHFELID